MAVRRDNRQVLDTLIQLAGDRKDSGLGRQQPIRMKPSSEAEDITTILVRTKPGRQQVAVCCR